MVPNCDTQGSATTGPARAQGCRSANLVVLPLPFHDRVVPAATASTHLGAVHRLIVGLPVLQRNSTTTSASAHLLMCNQTA